MRIISKIQAIEAERAVLEEKKEALTARLKSYTPPTESEE